MNWKDTIGTIKANYGDKHLSRYTEKERWNIVITTTWIVVKASVIGGLNQIIFRMPKPKMQSETVAFKAWFCEVFASEVLKR